MLRLVASLVGIPLLLVLLLAVALDWQNDRLGSLKIETMELGMLSAVILTLLAMLVIFLPMLLLISRFARISLWHSVAAGGLTSHVKR